MDKIAPQQKKKKEKENSYHNIQYCTKSWTVYTRAKPKEKDIMTCRIIVGEDSQNFS